MDREKSATTVGEIAQAVHHEALAIPLAEIEMAYQAITRALEPMSRLAFKVESDALRPPLRYLGRVAGTLSMVRPHIVNARTELLEYAQTLTGRDGSIPYTPVVQPYCGSDPKEAIPLDRHERVQTLESLIDPEGTLPHITLAATAESDSGANPRERRNWYIMHQGKVIGRCAVKQDHTNRTYHFHSITMSGFSGGTRIGKGFGTAAYLAVARDALFAGYTFRSDTHSTTDLAKELWERLVQRGAARVIAPFQEHVFGNYIGHYVIDGHDHRVKTPTDGANPTQRQA